MARKQVLSRCARCGSPVESGELLCERCREEEPAQVIGRTDAPPVSELEERARRWPPGMVRPSPVQYHATVIATIFVVLIGLAVFAFLSHRGVGPFQGSVSSFELRSGELIVEGSVLNQGSKESRANCRLAALDATRLEYASATFLTEVIPPGERLEIRRTVPDVSTEPTSVSLFCS